MSCWKCGKTLPAGEVECSGECAPPKLENFASIANAQRALCLTIELMLDEKTGCSDEAKAAVLRFAEMVGTAIADSGLSNFLKLK